MGIEEIVIKDIQEATDNSIINGDSLFDDLGIESLTLLEIMIRLEEDVGKEFTEDELLNIYKWKSVNELIDFIKKKV